MNDQPTDGQLWNALRGGDKAALKQIYDAESIYLYNYGKKIFQDITRVEDAIHDLFVDIWQRHKTLGDTDNIRWYLAASLRRRIVSDLKKTTKTQSVESFEQIQFEPELAIESILINQEISDEKSHKLKKAFATLSDRQKELLYLRFYQGLDYEQIGEMLDIQYQSLRNMVSRAIKKLRTEMLLWALIYLVWL